MKRFVSLLLALVLAVSMTGCWWDDEPSSQVRPTSTPRPTQSSTPLPTGTPGTSYPPPASSGAGSELPGNASGSMTPSQRIARAAAAAAAPCCEDELCRLEDFPHLRLEPQAAAALETLLEAARGAGNPLVPVSAYRSPDSEQLRSEGLLRRSRALGLAAADEELSRQHCLGLAADLRPMPGQGSEIFGTAVSFQWLKGHAHEYGFLFHPSGCGDFHLLYTGRPQSGENCTEKGFAE